MKNKSSLIEFFIHSLEQSLSLDFVHLVGLSHNHDKLQEFMHIQM